MKLRRNPHDSSLVVNNSPLCLADHRCVRSDAAGVAIDQVNARKLNVLPKSVTIVIPGEGAQGTIAGFFCPMPPSCRNGLAYQRFLLTNGCCSRNQVVWKGLVVMSACGVGGIDRLPGAGRLVTDNICERNPWIDPMVLNSDGLRDNFASNASL